MWRKREFQNKHASLAARFGAADARFAVGGDVFEVPDGTAHFLEHMAFETGKGSALGLFSRLGVQANAFTSHTETAYYFTGTDNFWSALRQLVRIVAATRLTPKGVEDEKRVICQEVRMYEDSPESRVYENLLEGLYAQHPIRRRVAGTVESVSSITPDILLRCHEAFYHPSNLVFVAAGDLDPERVFDTVEAELDKLGATRPAPPPERLLPDEPSQPARPRVRAQMPVKRPTALLGFKDAAAQARAAAQAAPAAQAPAAAQARAPAQPGEDLLRRDTAANLLVEVLFGPTSDLYNELYREGLIDRGFSARYTSGPTFGYAACGGATRDADLLCERLLEGILRWRQKGIAEPEFQRKRRKAHGRFGALFDSLEDWATLFLLFRLKGADFLAYPEVLDTIGLDEVNRVFGDLFAPDRVAVSMIVPR